jgi:hypothetical protein
LTLLFARGLCALLLRLNMMTCLYVV